MRPTHLSMVFLAIATAVVAGGPAACQDASPPSAGERSAWTLDQIVQSYLWPGSDLELANARGALAADPSLSRLTLMGTHAVEAAMRAGRSGYAEPSAEERLGVVQLVIPVPGGTEIPVFVDLPSGYDAGTPWPLMFAMHGGPSGTEQAAIGGARRMVDVWQEAAERAGWIVAAPAMVTALSQGGRTADRLPYEIFQPEIVHAIIDALRVRYNIDIDRVVSTGISLGSNFSIAYAAAEPHWLSGIVPVSTEGDSRELLLRNLVPVPTYVLEGALDQNIRAVSGPRALAQIVTDLGGEMVYREFSDRAHEGFAEHYGDVLRWLDSRPRDHYPTEVWRVPHSGIVPVSRRVFWIESDTRQGLIHAQVTHRSRIDIRARFAREIRVLLHDRLVNLDEPVEIWVNGERVFADRVQRSARTALEEARATGDERAAYFAEVVVAVPTSPGSRTAAQALSAEVEPTHEEGILSFWEMYAMRALEERFPSLGVEGEEVELDPELELDPALGLDPALEPDRVGIRLTGIDLDGPFGQSGLRTGDVLVEVAGEPFFRGQGGLARLHGLLLREMRGEAQGHTVRALNLVTGVSLSLGPYRAGAPMR